MIIYACITTTCIFFMQKNRINTISTLLTIYFHYNRIKLTNEFNNISITELEILSNNIYDYSYLIVHWISKEYISEYFLLKNNNYFERLSNIDKQNMIPSDNRKLRFLATLTSKHISY